MRSEAREARQDYTISLGSRRVERNSPCAPPAPTSTRPPRPPRRPRAPSSANRNGNTRERAATTDRQRRRHVPVARTPPTGEHQLLTHSLLSQDRTPPARASGQPGVGISHRGGKSIAPDSVYTHSLRFLTLPLEPHVTRATHGFYTLYRARLRRSSKKSLSPVFRRACSA